MMTTTLFERGRVQKWQGSRALVPSESLVCQWCGPTYDVYHAQPALFYDGGYGATEGRRARFCLCGAINIVSTFTLNPRRL